MSQLAASTARVARPPAELAVPLGRLRRRIARWFWLDGLRRLALTLAGLATGDYLLDRWLRLDLSQRTVMLVLISATGLSVAFRRLVRPLSAQLSDDALCLEVERSNQHLGQQLISAVQLARQSDWREHGASPELARATIAAGVRAATAADWQGVLDQKAERANLARLAGLALIVLGLVASCWYTPLPGIWWRRNVLLADVNWPQATYLRIQGLQDGKLRAPRGESLVVQVDVEPSSRVVPDRVFVEFRPARGRSTVGMNPIADARFEWTLARVIEPFELRVSGGDAQTGWVPVDLVEPPGLGQLRLTVVPPAYTAQEPAELPPGAGPHSVLTGSRLRLNAVSNKPLVAARLVHERGEWPAQIRGGTDVEWSLDEDQVAAGRYAIFLEDQQGVRPRQPLTFVLQVHPDRTPKVEARSIGVGGSVLPGARIPLNLRIQDDFAVQSARIAWQARGEGEPADAPSATVELPEFAPLAGRREVVFSDRLELAPLNLSPGRTLTFVVEARDNDELNGPKVGRSTEFLFRVVTPEELRADWLRREKEQRQELEQVLRNQDELLTDTRAVAAMSELSDAERATLSRLARRQKQVAQQAQAIAERLEAVAAEVVNNRLDSDPDRLADRIRTEIAGPLARVADPTLSQAQLHLEEARRLADEPSSRQRSLAAGAAAEQQGVSELQQVLDRMLKSEGFQEAVQLLYEIQKAQQEVLDRTQREKQVRIEAILRDGPTKPKGTP